MRIAVIGCGYVGLVSAACLAEAGHDVTCFDLDDERIDSLRAGKMPFYEPGLEVLVATTVSAGSLKFSHDIRAAVAVASVVLLAVGTPSRRGDGHADLTFVYQAAEMVGRALRGFTIVVTKSTVPVGTGDEIERIIYASNPQADFAVVANPEFLRQGAAISDFQRPARIVVGTDDARAVAVMKEMYAPFTRGGAPLVHVSRRTAELTKYASNAFLAMKLAFINEMADLCEATGADVGDVAHAMGLDSRIAPGFLGAGPGYGGSCLPKDARALLRAAEEFGSELSLVQAAVESNKKRLGRMFEKIVAACGGCVRGKSVAILGLAFKPGTDDLREAPALAIIGSLRWAGASIIACDPQYAPDKSAELGHLELAVDAYTAAAGADALVIVTGWPEFRSLDFVRLGALMRQRVLVDLRNILCPDDAARHGFRYHSIGRAAEPHASFATQAGEAAE